MKYTEQELIDELHRVSEEHCDGETPTQKDIRKHGKISSGTYQYRFGTWNEALVEANFELRRHRDYSKKDLLDEIKRISNQFCNNNTPTANDMTKYGKYSTNSYLRNFNSWNHALKLCGFDLNHREVTDEEIINDIKRVGCIVDDDPTLSEIEKYGKYSNSLYKSRWGTWNNALKESGFEPNSLWKNSPTGEDHPHWRNGGEDNYGKNWRRQRRKALERDGWECRVTGKAVEDIGMNLHVHHIKPRRKWDIEMDYQEMNSLDNLITLCASIHHQVEGMWQECNVEEFEEKAIEFFDSVT